MKLLKLLLPGLFIFALVTGCGQKKDPAEEALEALEQNLPEGVTLGEPIVMSGPEFLEMMQQQGGAELEGDFIYVKIPGTFDPFEREEKFAAPLGESLGEVGEVTGGGTGMSDAERYSGIDIIATDQAEAIKRITAKLKAINAPKGTEIQYSVGEESKTVDVWASP